MTIMPRTLDEAIEISDQLDGVTLRKLEANDTIHARTYHSDYEIVLLNPDSGKALVYGGRYFVEPVEATVSGSTFGGCIMKLGWLGVGLRIEISVNGQHILTSPVKSLRVSHSGADPESIDCHQQVVAN